MRKVIAVAIVTAFALSPLAAEAKKHRKHHQTTTGMSSGMSSGSGMTRTGPGGAATTGGSSNTPVNATQGSGSGGAGGAGGAGGGR